MTKSNNLSYSEMNKLQTFDERFKYLKQFGVVGESTFGGSRQLNQALYSSSEWKRTRRDAIIRDNGCDLGMPDRPIHGSVYIHHINPITPEDILNRNPKIFDLDNIVCVSFNTHQAIHFGDENLLPSNGVERKPNDTCPWR